MYLYRAIDSVGDTTEFHFSEHRDLPPWTAGIGPFSMIAASA